MRELTPSEVAAKAGGFRVLDVREPWEFEGPLGHIADADLLPLAQVERTGANWLAANPDGGIPLLVCRSGRRSADACRQLEALGAEDVVNLAGGMIAWHRAGLPSERTEPASPAALLDEIIAWLAQVRFGSSDEARSAIEPTIKSADSSFDSIDRSVVARVVDRVEAMLADDPPADAELCLAAFRRSIETF